MAISNASADSLPSSGDIASVANLSVIDSDRQLDIAVGQALFEKTWVSAPSSTHASDGLGPLYNARSCQACHVKAGRGRPPVDSTDISPSFVVQISVPAGNNRNDNDTDTDPDDYGLKPDPTYGWQLQTFAVTGLLAEARPKVTWEDVMVDFDDGEEVDLRRPRIDLSEHGYGPMRPDIQTSMRVAPAIKGLGLIEAISSEDIKKFEDPFDRDGDGISGRANRTNSSIGTSSALGRFGLKATFSTIDDQVQSAFAKDLGLGVPKHPDPSGDCMSTQTVCRDHAAGYASNDDLEVNADMVELVAQFVASIDAPVTADDDTADVAAGRELFNAARCNRCHREQYHIHLPSDNGFEKTRVIRPYTDLLLHDMGEGLADGRPDGTANGREWRTAPLWGVGESGQDGIANYLHDGRARTLIEAVLWHDGEARYSSDRVRSMGKRERHQLISFLESL
ncbi:MAG: thiol oxidoreductase [marine bacterium B5-7]|nr:MAG: thiol oxidoreductase [marine bacterium B5-7]